MKRHDSQLSAARVLSGRAHGADHYCADSGFKRRHQNKTEALICSVFWLHFCTAWDGGDVSFMFIHISGSKYCKETGCVLDQWWKDMTVRPSWKMEDCALLLFYMFVYPDTKVRILIPTASKWAGRLAHTWKTRASGCCEVISSSEVSDGVVSFKQSLQRRRHYCEAPGGVNKLSVDSSCGGTSLLSVPGVVNTATAPRDPAVPSVHWLPVPTWALSPPTDASAPPWSLLILHWQSDSAVIWQPVFSSQQLLKEEEEDLMSESWRTGVLTFSHSQNDTVRHSWMYDITNAGRLDKSLSIYWPINHQKQSCEQYFQFTWWLVFQMNTFPQGLYLNTTWVLSFSATFYSYSNTFQMETLYFLLHFIYLII